MLYDDDLEGWGRVKEVQEGGDMHIIMAGLHCCTAEIKTTL